MKDFFDPCRYDYDCYEPCCDYRPCPKPRPYPTPGPGPILREKDLLIAANEAGSILSANVVNQPITFNQIIRQSGFNISLPLNSSFISLREAGAYVVMYNITYAYNIIGTTTPATVSTILTLNQNNIVNGRTTNTLLPNTTLSQSAATVINVPQASMMTPVNLQLNILTNQPISFTNASISIYKLY